MPVVQFGARFKGKAPHVPLDVRQDVGEQSRWGDDGRLASGKVLDTHFPWEVVDFGIALQRDVDGLVFVGGRRVGEC